MCSKCAYRNDNIAGAICPECGTPLSTLTRTNGVFGVMLRVVQRRFVLLSVMCLLLVACCVSVFVWRAVPLWRLLSVLPNHGDVAPHIRLTPATSFPTIPVDGVTVSTPSASQLDRGLLVSVYRSSYWSRPVMEVRLGVLESRNGRTRVVAGTPAVLCRLSPAYTADVLTNGIPFRVDDALNEAADRISWRPLTGMASNEADDVIEVPVDAMFVRP